jgi:O-antigen/teichoic acid export membrane protein
VNGLIGFFYSYGDKFLLNHFIDNATLGQYSAYYTVSVMVVSQLALLFINVFFPTLVEKDQSRGVAKQLEKAYIKIGLWLFIPLVTWIYLVVGMLGAGYDQSIFLSVGFALLTYINTFFLLLWWQIAALGNKGVRFMIETGVISVCIFLGVFFLGVGHFSVYVTLLALNLALIFNIIRGRSFLQLNT